MTVTVSSGTASASDFAPVSAFTLTIDANQPFGTTVFTLTPTDDDVDEVDETLTVAGSTAVAGLDVTATTVTINDDDERGVQVSPTTLTVPEGADGTYTVVLTSQPTGDPWPEPMRKEHTRRIEGGNLGQCSGPEGEEDRQDVTLECQRPCL